MHASLPWSKPASFSNELPHGCQRQRQDFIAFIAGHPDDGVIMVGTGGVRKSRWGVGARGKSGGVRVIYYYHNRTMPLFLLTIFGSCPFLVIG